MGGGLMQLVAYGAQDISSLQAPHKLPSSRLYKIIDNFYISFNNNTFSYNYSLKKLGEDAIEGIRKYFF